MPHSHAELDGLVGTSSTSPSPSITSSNGASASSPSAWARSKAVGEENVRAAFPEATILRPAPVFGDEDRLLNRIAKLSRAFPVLPLVDGDAQQQPLFCDDFATALVEAATNRECAGKTYSLCGPKVYTNLQMAEYVFKVSCIDDPCRLTPSRHATQHHATPPAAPAPRTGRRPAARVKGYKAATGPAPSASIHPAFHVPGRQWPETTLCPR